MYIRSFLSANRTPWFCCPFAPPPPPGDSGRPSLPFEFRREFPPAAPRSRPWLGDRGPTRAGSTPPVMITRGAPPCCCSRRTFTPSTFTPVAESTPYEFGAPCCAGPAPPALCECAVSSEALRTVEKLVAPPMPAPPALSKCPSCSTRFTGRPPAPAAPPRFAGRPPPPASRSRSSCCCRLKLCAPSVSRLAGNPLVMGLRAYTFPSPSRGTLLFWFAFCWFERGRGVCGVLQTRSGGWECTREGAQAFFRLVAVALSLRESCKHH